MNFFGPYLYLWSDNVAWAALHAGCSTGIYWSSHLILRGPLDAGSPVFYRVIMPLCGTLNP